jgi:hypothetical protein
VLRAQLRDIERKYRELLATRAPDAHAPAPLADPQHARAEPSGTPLAETNGAARRSAAEVDGGGYMLAGIAPGAGAGAAATSARVLSPRGGAHGGGASPRAQPAGVGGTFAGAGAREEARHAAPPASPGVPGR